MKQDQFINAQREYFSILEEYFIRMAGTTHDKFADGDAFIKAMRQRVSNSADQARLNVEADSAFFWFEQTIRNFYYKGMERGYEDIRSLGGMKLVLDCGSYFTDSHFDATRKMLLYADTILIPDPVLPWIEAERHEERFNKVIMVDNIFTLLRLKPLVDANLPYPAIVVFPSWEISLEMEDKKTQEELKTFTTNFLSFYLDKSFSKFEEALSYSRSQEHEFLTAVDQKKLFSAPGLLPGGNLLDAIKAQRAEDTKWKSEDYQKMRSTIPDGLLVFDGICGRLTPQYHILRNADMFVAQPMLAFEQPWHYYSLCAKMYSGKLEQNYLIEPATISILRALQHSNLRWLGNVPIMALTELRKNNENEKFRRELEGYTKRLQETTLDDINRTAAEVGHGLSSLLASHEKEIQSIEDKYKSLHTQTAIGAWTSLSALLIPTLAPYVSGLTFTAATVKYATDKIAEIKEKKNSSKSLLGVLASARNI